ncbi:MAG: hypothetical protein AB1427_00745 [Thermodesulfobacteriota bacterium]
MAKKRLDPDTEAALAVVDMEQKQELMKLTEQQQREIFIAKTHEMVGQIRSANMFKKFADISSFVWLKQVKETKIYKDLPNVGTWESFCNHCGLSRQHVDEQLMNLGTLGEEFLLICQQLSVGYKELRKLRKSITAGDLVVEDKCVRIGDEAVPLDPDHAEDLQAAIESLLEAKNQQIEEQTATLRAKDKVLKDKEKVINKQARELARAEGRAEKAGYTPGEEALIQELDNSRTIIDGFLMRFDPEKNPLPEDATPRMKAKLMHTLDYFKRVILAAYDTAADLYGVPEIDDDWVPPHLRKQPTSEDQS